MTEAEYQACQTNVMFIASMLLRLPLSEFIEWQCKADAIGSVLDPTLYREALYSGNWSLIKDVSQALLHCQLSVRECLARHETSYGSEVQKESE